MNDTNFAMSVKVKADRQGAVTFNLLVLQLPEHISLFEGHYPLLRSGSGLSHPREALTHIRTEFTASVFT